MIRFPDPCRLYLATLLLALAFTPLTGFAENGHPKISARAWVLVDLDSGYVLSQQNEHLPLHPGGLTKLMTSYVLFQHVETQKVDLKKSIPIRAPSQVINSPRIFLRTTDTPSINVLLSAMIVHSANDAALALTDHFTDSKEAFVREMNRVAHVLGMTRTRFQNVTGMPDVNQATTAADLGLLARAIKSRFPQHQRYFKIRKIAYHDISHYNRNAMLWRDEFSNGMMASLNSATGNHVVATTSRNGMHLVAVVLGATSEARLFEGAQALLNYGVRNYETRLLYPKGQVLARIPVEGGSDADASVGALDNLYITLPRNTFTGLEARSEMEKKLRAPIDAGQDVGSLTLVYEGKTVAEHPLVALKPVPVGNAVQQAWGRFRNWLRAEDDAAVTDETGLNPDAQQ